MEGFEIALARFGLRQAVLEMDDRETGRRKAEAKRRQGVRIAVLAIAMARSSIIGLWPMTSMEP